MIWDAPLYVIKTQLLLTLFIVLVSNWIATEKLKEDRRLEWVTLPITTKKHNIEKESQRGFDIHKLHGKRKMAE